ncbi:unnamed protein product [Adineta ricciae]|uniref:Right handed beta helix domain-containing protein n=1 Tax=Adineta ricciae TaxID=249248 RepID=A0A813X5U5_ADIRI|nr:unnamed protein product [Adineta ricciae]
MNLILRVLIFHCFISILYAHFGPKYSPEPFYSLPNTVNNPNVPLDIDCALRAFAIEMANYIAPPPFKSNWTSLVESAIQFNQCHNTSRTHPHLQPSSPPTKSNQQLCNNSFYVHHSKGNDFFDGSFQYPFQTIQTALDHVRLQRQINPRLTQNTSCIIIRGGTYYLGTNASTTTSQKGVIALTSNDSNLIIKNYEDERVILSGGTLLDLKWSFHSKASTGGNIMKAEIPLWVNVDEFNELYIDDQRAIVAKYPNGDPSTQGLYADHPGFSYDSQGWLSPIRRSSVEIHVQEPYRNGTFFPYHQFGIGGGASVFDPPRNFWSTWSPPAGGNYGVPSGLVVKNGALPNLPKWSNPSTGFVHAFHSGYWGSWVFDIESVNSSQNTIVFGKGGFQEARGSDQGGPFYVSNIFEELDSPNEWFLDQTSRTLYFMPNDTMPNVFVASQVPCLISLGGSDINDPVENVLIQGLTFTQTSNTYMKEYMAPSGGDWSVHRGGTIYMRNTKQISIVQNVFTELGSNGIAIIDYNEQNSITWNEFAWLADSGVIVVGTTNGIDGYSVNSQPTNILIESNLFRETGIYMKQSSPVLIAVSRSIQVVGNVMFNMPRAGVNINDGYYGNHSISRNVIFNSVRETSDHGPINTWDRQPYLTDAVQPNVPSLWQHVTYIDHNVLFNNYRSVWPIDHDDGSCIYEDSYNFQVYGGKKNYLGHSKTDHHEIYVYSDLSTGGFGSNNCLNNYAPQRGVSAWNENWIENTCILYSRTSPYNLENCDVSDLYIPYVASNKIYIPPGSREIFYCKVNGTMMELNLQQWQSYGIDKGTVVNDAPDVNTIIDWGRKMLQG